MTSFAVKMIAALSMFLDHLGLLIFPQAGFLRVLGRLAFPLYAFCIAEGFLYTRNRKRYFLQVFLLGLVCQTVYFIADGNMYLGVLIAFSLSIILMWAADGVKKALAGDGSGLSRVLWPEGGKKKAADIALSAAVFLLMLLSVLLLCAKVDVDYGFIGVILPLLAFLPEKKPARLTLFALGLFALCIDMAVLGSFREQWWSLASLVILALYTGAPGKYRLKYFFYVFYPAHLAGLYLLAMFI